MQLSHIQLPATHTSDLHLAALGFLQNIGPLEIVLILVVVLLLFGGKKLPELARGLGRGMRLFKEEISGVTKSLEDEPAKTDQKPADQKPADQKPAAVTSEQKPDQKA